MALLKPFIISKSGLAINISAVQKKRAIYKDGTLINSFIALRLSFEVKADAMVHEFLLTQGLGHHRKMGFGMLSIKKRMESTL